LAAASAAVARRPNLPPAERGRRLAEKFGCFGCHGPGGLEGAKNPGRIDGSVPNFKVDVMMYAKTPEEIHEWIHFGVSRKKSTSRTWQADRDRGALRMPAFKDRMSERDMHDLVAYVLASSGSPAPDDSLAAHGLQRAEALGCVGCHGPGGRLARPNGGSFRATCLRGTAAISPRSSATAPSFVSGSSAASAGASLAIGSRRTSWALRPPHACLRKAPRTRRRTRSGRT
jgi:mono/diheme cytochrome c family protein